MSRGGGRGDLPLRRRGILNHPLSRRDAVETLIPLAVAPSGEEVDLADAAHRILATPINADRDHPPFNRSTMDGYAVRAADVEAGRVFPVAGSISAGSAPMPSVDPGACVAIATGAALPTDLDAVIEHERSNRENPVRFDLPSIEPGRNIHPRGVDRKAGAPVLSEGTRLGPAEIGIAASNGHHRISVRRRPTVALISTGDELVDIHETPGPWQLRDSNGPMLAAAINDLGGEVRRQTRAIDTLEATIDQLHQAMSHCDLVVTIGGVSAGERDHVPAAWEELGARPLINRAAIQPGRPIRAWQVDQTTAIALPGNPVSALVCLHLFARPWLRAGLGLDPLADWEVGELERPARTNPHRTALRPCHQTLRDSPGTTRVSVAAWHGSGDLPHLGGTIGIVELDPQAGPEIPAGTACPLLRWSP